MKKFAIAAAAALLLAGCMTATPYAPAAPGHREGFSESRIDQDHWRVSFSGNSATPRDTVETYLLYRAAELTVQQGYDWFETTQRSTERKSTYVPTGPDPWGYGPFWHPYWRYYRHGFWGPWGDPFWGDYEVEQIDRFQATAEIVMHKGSKPEGDKHAFDAHEVMTNLGPRVVRPQPKS